MFRVLTLVFILTLSFSLVLADEPSDMATQSAESTSNAHWIYGGGVGLGMYRYEEPGLMNLKGNMLRFDGSLTRQIERFHISIEAAIGFGSEDYEGAVVYEDGTVVPMTHSGIKDHLYEFRGLVGQTFPIGNNTLTASFGYGLRKLDNMLGDIEDGGYDRHSRYQYIPLRLCWTYPFSNQEDGGRLKSSIEYDYFVTGKQTSDLSDQSFSYVHGDTLGAEYSDLVNRQNGGHGLKGSLSWLLSQKANGINFMVTVYYDGWWIDESTKDEISLTVVHQDPANNEVFTVIALEPENRTREVGVKLALNWF